MTELTVFLKRVLALGCAFALAVPVAASARVTFSGDFETGDVSQWSLQQYCAGDANVYSADARPDWPTPPEGSNALQLSVPDNHVLTSGLMQCDSISGNPRAQIATNRTGVDSLGPGDDKWESWWVLIPSDFPLVTGSNWFVMQQDFGSPFGGSPPVTFDIKDDGSGVNQFVMDVCHDGCTSVTKAWSGPQIQPDRWYYFQVHKIFSTSDSVGRVELWLDGVRQTFADSSQTYYTRTLHENCACTPADQYRFYLNNYHADALTDGTSTTVYYDGARIRDYARWWR